MIIDFHTHAFPDALAQRAIGKLLMSSDGKNHTDGTVSDMIRKMDEWGIDKAVVCNIATNAAQTHNVNGFAIDSNKAYGRIISLGSLNPDMSEDEVNSEFDRLCDAGIRGIKIHPDFQKTYIDDVKYDKIFEGAIKRDMFVVTHAGLDRVSPNDIHALPEAILKVLDRHKGLKLIAAHMGGKEIWDDAEKKLVGKNLYFDTAVVYLSGIGKERAERMIKAHGSDKILFGSDCPWGNGKDEYEFINSLNISDEDKECIFCSNAKQLLGI